MSANGLHPDVRRAMALECAVEVTASRADPEATRKAAEMFARFLAGEAEEAPVALLQRVK